MKRLLLLVLTIACAQLSAQKSLDLPLRSATLLLDEVTAVEELASTSTPTILLPQIFALPIMVDYNLNNAGQWQKVPGGQLWRLEVVVEEASQLAFYYNECFLPTGATLHFYNKTQTNIKGAYTSANNRMDRRFMTGFVAGSTAILEYFEPDAVAGMGQISINRVDYGIQPIESEKDFGFGTSENCHNNINCTQGTDWQDEKKGVVRIIMALEEGTGYCSGTLMNNTNEDGKPYILTAYHCDDGYTPMYEMYRFDFEYESPTCSNPSAEPTQQSLLGAVRRAGWIDSDFQLFEVVESMPATWDVYYNGWDRSENVPSNSTIIHHPNGDIKKISLDADAATIHPNSLDWNNGVITPANHHFRSILDDGSYEVGSSGSAMFNQNSHVVGQLNGGFQGCNNPTAFYGRLAMSWMGDGSASTSLSDWLDPINTGVETLDGAYLDPIASGFLMGRVVREDDAPVVGVTVTLTGDVNATYVTDATGNWVFEEVPYGSAFMVQFEKDQGATNGVTTFDMVLMRKHILTLEPFDSPYKRLAADCNGNESITTADMVRMQKVILLLESGFTNYSSWRFVPAAYTFADPSDPWSGTIPSLINFTNYQQSVAAGLDFIAVKIGDVNVSNNPTQ